MGFASDIKTAAGQVDEAGRFGAKAFLAPVYEAYCELAGERIGWGTWAEMVLDAHQAGELELSRADLVPVMAGDMVEYSAVERENATFHFVRVAS